jgi:hypothetical protein
MKIDIPDKGSWRGNWSILGRIELPTYDSIVRTLRKHQQILHVCASHAAKADITT